LAGHLQNWHELVKPWLAQDKVVVSDRWWLSQFTYTVARDYDPDVQKLYEVKHGAWPDLTIFLYGDSRTLLERANARPDAETHQRRKSWNDADKQRRVRDRYFDLYSGRPGWTPICVDFKDEERVWQEVRRAIDQLLQERIANV
jgi:thymidylate kinase